MTGINDTSKGRCESALIIRGEHFRCDLAVKHGGWAHSNADAEAIWKETPGE
jgi:hypothetical protein